MPVNPPIGMTMTNDTPRPRTGSAAGVIVEGLKSMITLGELSPGEQIRQEKMATHFGVSRLPIREALRQLAAEGVITHSPNVGYAVARLSQAQFEQLYLVRRLLETAILEHLPPVTEEFLARLRALNEGMADAAEAVELAEMRRVNEAFHFEIFRWSGLELLVDEVARMWTFAMPYHALYLVSDTARATVLAEHAQMIDALEAGDTAALVDLMNLHRQGPERQLGAILGGR